MSGDNESLESPWRGGLICARPSQGLLCTRPPEHDGRHSWDAAEGEHVGSKLDVVYDLVIKDLLSRDPRWDVSVGLARHIRDRVAEDLLHHRDLGIYAGSDFLRAAYDGLIDAVVSARHRLLEIPENSLEYTLLFDVYDDTLAHMVRVRRLLDAASE